MQMETIFAENLVTGKNFGLSHEVCVNDDHYPESINRMSIFKPRPYIRFMADHDSIKACLAKTVSRIKHTHPLGGFYPLLVNGSSQDIFVQAVQPIICRVLKSIQAQAWNQLAEQALNIAGVGIGQTPAGDDLLTGLIASLSFHRAVSGLGPSPEILESLAAKAEKNTSRFSGFMLRSAAGGWVSQLVSDWLIAVHQGDFDHIEKITMQLLRQSYSRGINTLTGMILGLGSILTIKK